MIARLLRELAALLGRAPRCPACGGHEDPAVGYCTWCS